VAAVDTEVAQVAALSSASLNAVASQTANIAALGPISADITTVASNIGAVQSASVNALTAQSAATSASLSALSATSSASAASASASAASSSAASAAASFDSFDDRYLGAKSSAPSVDNDGNALITGALYWNSTSSLLYIWTGSGWDQAAFSVSGAVTSFNTRTGAVTLSSTDVTNALTFTPATAASVSAIPDPVAMALVFGS
jgi:hypothetical protein